MLANARALDCMLMDFPPTFPTHQYFPKMERIYCNVNLPSLEVFLLYVDRDLPFSKLLWFYPYS